GVGKTVGGRCGRERVSRCYRVEPDILRFLLVRLVRPDKVTLNFAPGAAGSPRRSKRSSRKRHWKTMKTNLIKVLVGVAVATAVITAVVWLRNGKQTVKVGITQIVSHPGLDEVHQG